MRAIVEKGVVPRAWVVFRVACILGAGGTHYGHQGCVRNGILFGEELVEKDGAHVCLKVDARKVEGKRANPRSRSWANAGKRL